VPPTDSPWVEAFRSYLHLLGAGQIVSALNVKVDLSGVVQQTLAECAAVSAPTDENAARGLLRVAFLNNLRDAIRFWKAQKRDARREIHSPTGAASEGDAFATLAALTTPSVVAVRRETEERLTAALAELPDEQQTAVLLHHLLELPVSEVAGAMNRTVPSVAGLLRRGLERLREILTEQLATG
jgi:RNA polymerase sigma-70 factor, ECF subfamily